MGGYQVATSSATAARGLPGLAGVPQSFCRKLTPEPPASSSCASRNAGNSGSRTDGARQAILNDPGFPDDPARGLELARQIAHLSYRAEPGLHDRVP